MKNATKWLSLCCDEVHMYNVHSYLRNKKKTSSVLVHLSASQETLYHTYHLLQCMVPIRIRSVGVTLIRIRILYYTRSLVHKQIYAILLKYSFCSIIFTFLILSAIRCLKEVRKCNKQCFCSRSRSGAYLIRIRIRFLKTASAGPDPVKIVPDPQHYNFVALLL